jgi:hypothetical protein
MITSIINPLIKSKRSLYEACHIRRQKFIQIERDKFYTQFFIGLLMICPHGLAEESCHLCRIEMRIKPSTRLIDPMPTDLPLTASYTPKSNESQLPQNDLIQSNKSFPNTPQNLGRNMNLRENFFAPQSPFLQNRLNSIENNGKLDSLPTEMPLFDVKKKFLQK